MGRLLGYMANRADRLAAALHHEKQALGTSESGAPSSWGIGFYHAGEVLHKKRRIVEGTPFDWSNIAKDVRSDCVVVNLRHATVGDFRMENAHPFRLRSWLFAHSGTIDGFERIRPRIAEQLPDFLQRSIRGTTDSEHFFHLALSFLHDEGQLDNPDAAPQTVLGAIRAAVRTVDRMAREVDAQAPTLNCILTNGRTMYALRKGSPLMVAEREGVALEDEVTPERSPHGSFRYVAVVSENIPVPVGYREVPEASICVVDRMLNVSIEDL